MPDGANAATELACQHTEISALAGAIVAIDAGPERTALVHELAARFMLHAQAEERYLYPAVRRLLPHGAAEAAGMARRQRAIGRTVEAVERTAEQDDEFDILVGQLVVAIQDHVERQDSVLLPALIDACPIDELVRLGGRLREGLVAAHEAAERAGARAGALAGAEGHRPDPAHTHGFKALLRRIARTGAGGRTADVR